MTERALRGAARLVACAAPQAGEQVLILTDDGLPAEITALFRTAVEDTGAEATLVQMRRTAITRSQPSPVAAAGFTGADIVIELTTQFVQHSEARQRGQRNGLRYLFIGDIDEAMLAGPGAVYADFAGLAPRIEGVADIVTASETMRLTTAAGTDITLSTAGRPGRALTGLAKSPGQFGAPPCLEAGVIPVPGTATGTIVVDAYCVGIGLVSEPFTVEVENGSAVRIHGSPEAERLRRLLGDTGSPHAFDVCEVGIGLNDTALLIDNVTSAESCYGTAHIAVGTTPADPGIEIVDAGIHVDMVFHAPTIEIGGRTVFRDGELVADTAAPGSA
ncbi:leucyl aminopeptidase (aminopeptidase T) [Murinocardiopsis flavida]|uniref:Leucyl aminopeptidase (Aminopeptidase T) n=1 Tax=Murinocardiopsis flavida TaxID=645275 RepID=A0A2P8CLY7_9ACTN|nr:hypothetical protein [Murinocardiopsis flavida]PSK85970.1 leucyl aminopeptidase (aminopeptidase T) [Murinocardiopsis flavida]